MYKRREFDEEKRYPVFFYVHGRGWASHKIFEEQKQWQRKYIGFSRIFCNWGQEGRLFVKTFTPKYKTISCEALNFKTGWVLTFFSTILDAALTVGMSLCLFTSGEGIGSQFNGKHCRSIKNILTVATATAYFTNSALQES